MPSVLSNGPLVLFSLFLSIGISECIQTCWIKVEHFLARGGNVMNDIKL